VLFPDVVGWQHATIAKSLVLRRSVLKPLNDVTIQKITCKFGLTIFEYEYIRVLHSLKKMKVAERRDAKATTQHNSAVGLAVRRATIVLRAESCRQ